MSADELRSRFAQIAERVVPMEDPHGRLMSRRRKRFRARIASLATVTAAVLAGGVAAPTTMLSFGARPELPPTDVVVQSTDAVSKAEFIARLVKAPVRGNLSEDRDMVAEVEKAFQKFDPGIQGAGDPAVVFLNRTDQMFQAVVIYTGGDEPIAVARGTHTNGSVEELLSSPFGYLAPVTPFLVMPVSDDFGKARGVIGLAPPGCSIEHSTKGWFTADGAWVRSYEPEPTGDYITRSSRTVNELWRVGCDGKIREVRIADDYLDAMGVQDNPSMMYDRAVRFGGTLPSKGVVLWRGKIPGFESEATLVGPRSTPGPAMLAIGPFLKAVLATDLPGKEPTPSPTAKDEEWSMIALGIASEGLTAVRIPQPMGNRTVLGDQVLVYTDTAATMVEALDPKLKVISSAPVKEGMAILAFSPGYAEEVRAVTSRGTEASSVRFIELPKGSRILGDHLFKDW